MHVQLQLVAVRMAILSVNDPSRRQDESMAK